MKSICFICTTPYVVNAFLLGHLQHLADEYDVTLCTNLNAYPLADTIDPRIHILHIPIARKISIPHDLITLFYLLRILWSQDFFAIQSQTPKAGLLGMIAGFICRVPNRLHIFTGQVWATQTGLKRKILIAMERLIANLATNVFTDGQSQCALLEDALSLKPKSVCVLGQGTVSGVDVKRFCPKPDQPMRIRKDLNISKNSFVILFIARLNHDKGAFDIIRAFNRVLSQNTSASLWVVGPDEEDLTQTLQEIAGRANRSIRWIGPTSQPESFMSEANIVVLPSYREGFCMVLAEAAASGLPVVAYDIDGMKDAVIHKTTGLLVPVGNVENFADAILEIANDKTRAKAMGTNARQRICNNFTKDAISAAWLEYYRSLN